MAPALTIQMADASIALRRCRRPAGGDPSTLGERRSFGGLKSSMAAEINAGFLLRPL